MGKVIGAVAIFFLSSFVPAQAFLIGSDPDDITVVSVDIVDSKKRPESKSPGVVSRLQAMVKFTTKVNLKEEWRRYGYVMSNHAFLCNNGVLYESKELINDPYVYDDKSYIEDSDYKPPETESRHKYEYKIYVALRTLSSREVTQVGFQYNLQTEPQNFCFSITGLNSFIRFTSNTVVIPKEQLIGALSRARALLKKSGR